MPRGMTSGKDGRRSTGHGFLLLGSRPVRLILNTVLLPDIMRKTDTARHQRKGTDDARSASTIRMTEKCGAGTAVSDRGITLRGRSGMDSRIGRSLIAIQMLHR
jgi:hypothetical protein